MATINTFDYYISNINTYDDPELRNFIKKHREILLELQTEDEQSRYFEEFMKEINIFIRSKKHKK